MKVALLQVWRVGRQLRSQQAETMDQANLDLSFAHTLDLQKPCDAGGVGGQRSMERKVLERRREQALLVQLQKGKGELEQRVDDRL